jgi:cell volume regulation protein A
MDFILVLGIILVISALSSKASGKFGLPVLVAFGLIGILIGNWYEFANLAVVEHICDFALLMIIFTGGFQTNYAKAKPVLVISSVLSVAGTVLTAAIAGGFAYFVLGFSFNASMLLGAIISATDAESVFSVLHSKQMSLKRNLAPLLEIESGSNDPFAHMLTLLLISIAKGGSHNIALFLVLELGLGILSGVVFALLGRFVINRLNVDMDGLYAVLLLGTAFITYGVAAQFGGNGFLSVYIGGIILGNGTLVYKRFLSRLYSTISVHMQILLFIVLGILCIPESILAVAGSGVLFAAFLLLVARPVVMFLLMKPFGRPLREIALVSWAGFRGASSVVFATHLLISGLPYAELVFSIVFFVSMLSVIVQGVSIVPFARKLGLVED